MIWHFVSKLSQHIWASSCVAVICHLKFVFQLISRGNQEILIWRLKDDKESILGGWIQKAFDIYASDQIWI